MPSAGVPVMVESLLDVRARGKWRLVGAGPERQVGVVQFVGVFCVVGDLHAVERGGDAMGLVVAVEGDFAAAGDADVVQRDVAHGGRRVALAAGRWRSRRCRA